MILLYNGQVHLTHLNLFYKDIIMPVPYTFATATAPLPLSQLDANFATAITIGTTSLTLGSTLTSLPVSAGGTGLTTLTAGYIPYGNGTSAFSSSANLTFNGTLLSLNNSASTQSISASNLNIGLGTAFFAGQSEIYTTSTNPLGIGTYGSAVLRFYTAASERMVITSAGNVGIGTSSPSALLTVNGDASISGLTVGRGGGAVGTNVVLGNGLSLNATGARNAVFGNNTLTNPIGTKYSFFITKINTDGDVVWVKAIYEKNGDVDEFRLTAGFYGAGSRIGFTKGLVRRSSQYCFHFGR